MIETIPRLDGRIPVGAALLDAPSVEAEGEFDMMVQAQSEEAAEPAPSPLGPNDIPNASVPAQPFSLAFFAGLAPAPVPTETIAKGPEAKAGALEEPTLASGAGTHPKWSGADVPKGFPHLLTPAMGEMTLTKGETVTLDGARLTNPDAERADHALAPRFGQIALDQPLGKPAALSDAERQMSLSLRFGDEQTITPLVTSGPSSADAAPIAQADPSLTVTVPAGGQLAGLQAIQPLPAKSLPPLADFRLAAGSAATQRAGVPLLGVRPLTAIQESAVIDAAKADPQPHLDAPEFGSPVQLPDPSQSDGLTSVAPVDLPDWGEVVHEAIVELTEAPGSPAALATGTLPVALTQGPATGITEPAVVQSTAQLIISQAEDRAEVLLEPAELGRLRFEITQRGDGVQILLMAERPETLDLLRRNADQLLGDLKSMGFSGSELGFGSWRNEDQHRPAPTTEPAIESEMAFLPPPFAEAKTSLRGAGGGLDLRL